MMNSQKRDEFWWILECDEFDEFDEFSNVMNFDKMINSQKHDEYDKLSKWWILNKILKKIVCFRKLICTMYYWYFSFGY